MRRRSLSQCVRLASIMLLTACAEAPVYRETLVLVEDNRQRCESIISEVLVYWEQGVPTPAQSINIYYSSDGLVRIAALEVSSVQAREVLSRVSKRSGETRDLLLEFYAAVERLCDLARSPAGHNRLTFTDWRAVIRDELGGVQAKLEILLPVSNAERAAILRKYAPAVRGAESRARAQKLAAENALVAALERRESIEREASERAEAAERESIERTAVEESERKHLEQQAAEENRRQLELARQAQAVRHREYLRSSKPQAKVWIEQHYRGLSHFCAMSGRFVGDLQASHFDRFRECSVLEKSIEMVRNNAGESSATPEISAFVRTILVSYKEGAEACLRRSVLISTVSFSRGATACGQLRKHLREYGFMLEGPPYSPTLEPDGDGEKE